MYEWVKAAHIISVIAWLAGMLYLPRLFVYHLEFKVGSQASETFKIMERRLLKIIMTPAMMASWGFGIWLMILTHAWNNGWFLGKFFLVVLLTVFHVVVSKWTKELASDTRERSARLYRIVNEIPAVLMIFIVILVVVQPFK